MKGLNGQLKSLIAFLASLVVLFAMARYCPESKTTDSAMAVIATIVPAYLIYRSGQDKNGKTNGITNKDN